MALLELTLLLLAAVLASALIQQFVPKIAIPLIQILLGVCIELFTAESVNINFNTNLFLVLFIAPLIYEETRHADKTSLLKNLKPVLRLAIGLVLITMLVIGAVIHWLIPAIPFAAACMLGAALGPTDAIAVASLPKDIDMGERRKKILQGEYLLNDATGIVGFQFALVALTAGHLSIFSITGSFIFVFFGGILIGVLLGFLANFAELTVRRVGVEGTSFHVLFDLFMPFILYLTANSLGASGIMSVVVGGLVRSLNNRGVEPQSSRLSIVSESVWQTISFALNGIVWVLLGTQLPRAMGYSLANPHVGNDSLMLWVLIVCAVLLAIRFLWLCFEEWLAHKNLDEKPTPRQLANSALLMTLAGSKGAVTLSVIFSIPVVLGDTAFFPERNIIIFLACGVTLLIFLLGNFVLPLFAPSQTLTKDEKQTHQQDLLCSIEILRSVIQNLLAQQTPETAEATEHVVNTYQDRIARLKTSENTSEADDTALRLEVFDWEREFVQREIAAGNVEPIVGYRYITRVDQLEHALLRHSERSLITQLLNEVKEAFLQSLYCIVPKLSISSRRQSLQLRELQARGYRILISRLKRELDGEHYPAESVSAVLLDYQHALVRLRAEEMADPSTSEDLDDASSSSSGEPSNNKATSSSSLTFSATRHLTGIFKLAEVEERAIRLELNAIQEAYDAKRLSRQAAKRLKEDVILMQMATAEGEQL